VDIIRDRGRRKAKESGLISASGEILVDIHYLAMCLCIYSFFFFNGINMVEHLYARHSFRH
jgi:hypothetical protein